MTVERIYGVASELPRSEQGELITQLLRQFGPPDYQVSDEQVAQRIQETREGEIEDLSHDEFLLGIDHLREP